MTRVLRKIVLVAVGIGLLVSSSVPVVSAEQYASVSLPTFNITMNEVRIDNNVRQYPIIVYKDITYVPMTYNDSRFLGLETDWTAETGLQVKKISQQLAYNPNRGALNTNLESAVLPTFRILVNGKNINNAGEPYPLLVFRDITYFPLTWRFMVDEFGWTSNFDLANGLVISSKGAAIGSTTPTTPTVTEKVFSQNFGSTTVFFDRASNQLPGNLYVKENNSTRKVGNPNYIYGVGYLQAGSYGEYSAVDKLEFANRWVYTLAVDPSIKPITSRNVRVNVDTNEVQVINDGTTGDTGNLSGQYYSRQFNNVTVMLDRYSNRQPGNLYAKENNITKRIGNPNFIYGMSYAISGGNETYTAVDNLNLSNRWVYTLAIDPFASPITSRNVRINMDTNEVQAVDGSTINDTGNLSNQVYSRQFNDITVILDRASNTVPGNLYVRINNVTKKVGNPNFIYGVSYLRWPFELYRPVDNLNLTDRWVYTLAIDPAASPIVGKNARINIDTNEVQFVN